MGVKPTLVSLTTGNVDSVVLNHNLNVLAEAIANLYARAGLSTTNNTITGTLDMGGFEINPDVPDEPIIPTYTFDEGLEGWDGSAASYLTYYQDFIQGSIPLNPAPMFGLSTGIYGEVASEGVHEAAGVSITADVVGPITIRAFSYYDVPMFLYIDDILVESYTISSDIENGIPANYTYTITPGNYAVKIIFIAPAVDSTSYIYIDSIDFG